MPGDLLECLRGLLLLRQRRADCGECVVEGRGRVCETITAFDICLSACPRCVGKRLASEHGGMARGAAATDGVCVELCHSVLMLEP